MVYAVAPRALQHLKFGEVRRIARCWKMTRKDGSIRRFTNHSCQLEVATSFTPFTLETFTPSLGPNRDSCRRQSGPSPDTDSIRAFISSGGWSGEEARVGLFSDCRVEVFDVDWKYPFAGDFFRSLYYMVDIQWSGEEIEFRLATVLQRALVAVGRYYSPRCDAQLFDARCGLSSAGFASGTKTVTAIPSGNPRLLFESNLTGQPDSYWKDGTITWLSGNNAIAGLATQQIKASKQTNGRIQLWTPTPYDIEVGDTFSALPGCNLLLGQHCHGKYANSPNHRGFPQLPGMDKIMKPQDSKL